MFVSKGIDLRFGFIVATVLSATPALAENTHHFVALGTLGGDYSIAADINESRQVVGDSKLADGTTRGYLYDGSMQDLGTLSASATGRSSAYAINDGGVIAGSSKNDSPSYISSAGFVYVNGVMQSIINDVSGMDPAEGPHITAGVDINSSGQVAFSTAWETAGIWTNGVGTEFGGTEARGINDNGTFLYSDNAYCGGTYALYQSSTITIGDDDCSGLVETYNGVNNGDIAFGSNFISDFYGDSEKGLIYDLATNTKTIVFGLNSILAMNDAGIMAGIFNGRAAYIDGGATIYLDEVLNEGNWQSLDAITGINENGDFVGYGTTASGETQAFMATVVPVPAAVWLFGSALAGLGWMRRKQTV